MKRTSLFLLFFICNFLFAQDISLQPRNNTIKGVVLGFPFSYLTATLSYERNFTTSSSLELGVNYTNNSPSGSDAGTEYRNIFLAYRYSFSSKNRIVNNLWLSPYARYATFENFSDYTNRNGNIYGIGCSLGKRVFLTKNKRLIFDFGYGIAPTIKDVTHLKVWNSDTHAFVSHDPYRLKFLKSRLILLLGFNF